MTVNNLQKLIQNVPDFPKAGVNFKDITPLLENGEAFNRLIAIIAELVPSQTSQIVAIESRGFILGSAVAQMLNCGLVLARKPGKLPRATYKEVYDLEYGQDALEIHKDSLKAGSRVTIIDDVLATGGTASAAERLCLKAGAQVLGSLYLMEIPTLNGRAKLMHNVQCVFGNHLL